MNVHFIAIGGSIMHSLAIALKKAGHLVTGSDDDIFDPARRNLQQHGLLPEPGWNPDNIHTGLDAVILGMHAFLDNPELNKARELGLPVYSFPEFLYKHSLQKQRIVITGSYGKTTVTSMIMHALEKTGHKFDYAVGAEVPGFDNPVRLSDDAPVIVVEGDEYLASKEDPQPKFLIYKAHMVAITGISWDHVNVFPTEASYDQAFIDLLRQLDKAGEVVFNEADHRLTKLVKDHTDPDTHYLHPFQQPSYKIKDGKAIVKLGGSSGPMTIMGAHNMTNLAAAWSVCKLLGVEIDPFLEAMSDFQGAGLRMQKLYESHDLTLIRDYAHAPAKVKATVEAAREWYPKSELVACLELHTFSSLDPKYLPYYAKTLHAADQRVVYVDPHALEKRRMDMLTEAQVRDAFAEKKLDVFFDAAAMQQHLAQLQKKKPTVTLLMSSGPMGGLKWESLVN